MRTKFSVGKDDGKRPPERPKYRREDHIKIDLKGNGVIVWVEFILT